MSHHRRKRNVRTVHARNDEHIYVSRSHGRSGGGSSEGHELLGWLVLIGLGVITLPLWLPLLIQVIFFSILGGLGVFAFCLLWERRDEIGRHLKAAGRRLLGQAESGTAEARRIWNRIRKG